MGTISSIAAINTAQKFFQIDSAVKLLLSEAYHSKITTLLADVSESTAHLVAADFACAWHDIQSNGGLWDADC